MQKQAPTLGRVLMMVGFALSCFGLLLFLWLAFGGPVPLQPKGYRFNTSFAEATQLAKEADVRISGVSVGKVKTIEPDKTNGRARAVIEIDPEYAPIAKDTKAILRQKTLLGETYVELTPGNGEQRRLGAGERHARPTPGSRRPSSSTRSSAPSTRRPASRSRTGCSSSRSGPRAAAATSTTRSATSRRSPRTRTRCCEILNSQSGAVRRLVSNTGEVFDALSERHGQLAALITELQHGLRDDRAAQQGAAGRPSSPCRPSRRKRRRRSSA